MDRGAWCATVHGVPKNWTPLSMCTHTHTQQISSHSLLLKGNKGEENLIYGQRQMTFYVEEQKWDKSRFLIRNNVSGKMVKQQV